MTLLSIAFAIYVKQTGILLTLAFDDCCCACLRRAVHPWGWPRGAGATMRLPLSRPDQTVEAIEHSDPVLAGRAEPEPV